MKKDYYKPELDVLNLMCEDVIAVSAFDDNATFDDFSPNEDF